MSSGTPSWCERGNPQQPEIYTSLFWPTPLAEADLLVRTDLSPSSLAAVLREAIGPGSDLAVSYVRPVRQIFQDEIWPQRFLATFVAMFALLALALAALGVYGLLSLSWATRMRSREIALRRALGAPDGRILRQILGQMIGVLLIGEGAGALSAAALTQMFRSWFYWFYWFSPADPLSYLSAGLALLIVGLVAAYVPLRRALGIGPAAALRSE